jgi:hypothetical protein
VCAPHSTAASPVPQRSSRRYSTFPTLSRPKTVQTKKGEPCFSRSPFRNTTVSQSSAVSRISTELPSVVQARKRNLADLLAEASEHVKAQCSPSSGADSFLNLRGTAGQLMTHSGHSQYKAGSDHFALNNTTVELIFVDFLLAGRVSLMLW